MVCFLRHRLLLFRPKPTPAPPRPANVISSNLDPRSYIIVLFYPQQVFFFRGADRTGRNTAMKSQPTRGGAAISLRRVPAAVVVHLLLLSAFSSCVIYMMHLQSIVDCASSVDGPMTRPRIIPLKSMKTPSITTVTPTSTPSHCRAEYDRITSGQTPGVTSQDLRRSQACFGNRHRLLRMMSALSSRRRPVIAVVAGGSISLGHGVTPESARYGDRFERWMNEMYPLEQRKDVNDKHGVINVAAHGADMCAMAKRLNVLYSDLSSKLPPSSNGSPDLIILEFAVNDYQGQDHLITVDSKKSIFFDGFRELVLCAEVVIHELLNRYPSTGILFLEMQTAIATRKTGALLHMGVGKFEAGTQYHCHPSRRMLDSVRFCFRIPQHSTIKSPWFHMPMPSFPIFGG